MALPDQDATIDLNPRIATLIVVPVPDAFKEEAPIKIKIKTWDLRFEDRATSMPKGVRADEVQADKRASAAKDGERHKPDHASAIARNALEAKARDSAKVVDAGNSVPKLGDLVDREVGGKDSATDQGCVIGILMVPDGPWGPGATSVPWRGDLAKVSAPPTFKVVAPVRAVPVTALDFKAACADADGNRPWRTMIMRLRNGAAVRLGVAAAIKAPPATANGVSSVNASIAPTIPT